MKRATFGSSSTTSRRIASLVVDSGGSVSPAMAAAVPTMAAPGVAPRGKTRTGVSSTGVATPAPYQMDGSGAVPSSVMDGSGTVPNSVAGVVWLTQAESLDYRFSLGGFSP